MLLNDDMSQDPSLHAFCLKKLFLVIYDLASEDLDESMQINDKKDTFSRLASYVLESAVSLNQLKQSNNEYLFAQREALSALQMLLPTTLSALRKWVKDSDVQASLSKLSSTIMEACGDFQIQSLIAELIYRIQKSGIKLQELFPSGHSTFRDKSFQRLIKKTRGHDILNDLRLFINSFNNSMNADQQSVQSFLLVSISLSKKEIPISDRWMDFGLNQCSVYLQDENSEPHTVDIGFDSISHVTVRKASKNVTTVSVEMNSIPKNLDLFDALETTINFTFDEKAEEIIALLQSRRSGREMKIYSQNLDTEKEATVDNSGDKIQNDEKGEDEVDFEWDNLKEHTTAVSEFDRIDGSEEKIPRKVKSLPIKSTSKKRTTTASDTTFVRNKKRRSHRSRRENKAKGQKQEMQACTSKSYKTEFSTERNTEFNTSEKTSNYHPELFNHRKRVSADHDSPNCTDLIIYNNQKVSDYDVNIENTVQVLGRHRETVKDSANSTLVSSFRNIREKVKDSLQCLENDLTTHHNEMVRMCDDKLGGFDRKLMIQLSTFKNQHEEYAHQLVRCLENCKATFDSLEQTRVELEATLERKSQQMLHKVSEIDMEATTLINKTEKDVRNVIRSTNNTTALKHILNALL